MKINKLLYAGAALTLLGACAPAVKAPEAILPVPEEKQVDLSLIHISAPTRP